jgi:hypothetical protein
MKIFYVVAPNLKHFVEGVKSLLGENDTVEAHFGSHEFIINGIRVYRYASYPDQLRGLTDCTVLFWGDRTSIRHYDEFREIASMVRFTGKKIKKVPLK